MIRQRSQSFTRPTRSADWKDEANWHAVNPGLKFGYPDLYGLRQLAKEAEVQARRTRSL